MHQVPIESRLLSSVAYNADSQTLHVWFRNKRHVVHQNISEAVYANLIDAESTGFYYTVYIARKEQPVGRHGARTVAKLAAACLISILMIGAFASSVAAPPSSSTTPYGQTQ